MDSKFHDKIVDYLMQYRMKLPKTDQLSDKFAVAEKTKIVIAVDNLIMAKISDWLMFRDILLGRLKIW